MKTLVIGCKTLENELLSVMETHGSSCEVTWIEARMHNVKVKLREALQKIIDMEEGYDRLLFATGFCGNSISGLQSRSVPLVIPRVDDCTSLLFGSRKNKLPWMDSYFLTEGWLDGDANIWNEYLYAQKKYGAKKAAHIFRTIFSQYKRILLLDTGCYPLEPSLKKAQEIASAFSLECQVHPVNTFYLETLLTGPWDTEHFLTIPPHTTITDADLTLIY